MSKNLINIQKYFGNKEFAKANEGREFTIPEMLSIMMHSREVSVEERARDMQVLASNTDNALAESINRCVANELKKLDIIKHTKADDICFVSYGNELIGKYINKHATFEETMASGVNDEAVFINAFSDPEHRSASIAHFYVKNGVVTNTHVTSECAGDRDAHAFMETKVSLECPFQPFDSVMVGGKRYIVAERNADTKVEEATSVGWLNVDMPVYKVASDGAITIEVVHNMPWMLDEISRLDASHITLSDIRDVEYIKNRLKNRLA